MFSKQFITIPHSKDLFFRVHSHAFNSFIFTVMWKSKTLSNFEWCGGWNNGVVGSWTTWFLDFNRRVAWNKRGGAKFGLFLRNVVTEITELRAENSQKINCRDVTSIRKGKSMYLGFFILFAIMKIVHNNEDCPFFVKYPEQHPFSLDYHL